MPKLVLAHDFSATIGGACRWNVVNHMAVLRYIVNPVWYNLYILHPVCYIRQSSGVTSCPGNLGPAAQAAGAAAGGAAARQQTHGSHHTEEGDAPDRNSRLAVMYPKVSCKCCVRSSALVRKRA